MYIEDWTRFWTNISSTIDGLTRKREILSAVFFVRYMYVYNAYVVLYTHIHTDTHINNCILLEAILKALMGKWKKFKFMG